MIRGFGVTATNTVLKGIWGPKGGVLRDQAVLEEISQRKTFCKGGTRARAGGASKSPHNPCKVGQGQLTKLQLTERGGFQDKMARSLEEIRAWREEWKRPPGNECK